MRTETRTYTIYTLSELTEEARQKAYSDWLRHSEYDWADENAAALKKFEQIFNIEVRSWNYDGCTYGYRFVSHYSGEVEEMHGARLVAYLMNNYWHHLFLRKTYRNKDFTHKRSSRIFYDTDCVLTGVLRRQCPVASDIRLSPPSRRNDLLRPPRPLSGLLLSLLPRGCSVLPKRGSLPRECRSQ